MVFIGEHSHRSKATAEEIADGRFVCFETVKQAADFLKDSAIADEIILVKSAGKLHLERLVMTFFAPVRCWEDACGGEDLLYRYNGARLQPIRNAV